MSPIELDSGVEVEVMEERNDEKTSDAKAVSPLASIVRGKVKRPRRCLLYGVHGCGKAQPLDAKVLTPNGFVNMGELSVGDKVIGANGSPCKVIGVYPQGVKEVFEVTFRDGSKTRCCEDHLWFTRTFNERKQGLPGAVRSLAYIRESLRYGTHFNHAVPRVKAVQFAEKTLPVDPWLLGVYLGDGCWGTSVSIYNPEADIQLRIRAVVESMGDALVVAEDKLHMRITGGETPGSGFRETLKYLGLTECKSETKFIPDEYLYGSVEQRTQLLQGLCDADGYVTRPGSVEYATVSKQLAEDFCFLVRSLGGSACVRSYVKDGTRVECQLVYRIFASFPLDVVPVSSEKHLARYGDPEWRILHTIRDVQSVGFEECQCIRVDAADSLYVTDDFVVTHNTTWAAKAPSPIFVQTEDGAGDIDAAKFPVAQSLPEFRANLVSLRDEKHDFKTVVVDSLDWLEQRLIWPAVCQMEGVKTITDIDWGKGYDKAAEMFRKMLTVLDQLRDNGMTVVLIAHSKIETQRKPNLDPYDKYLPAMHRHVVKLVEEWADEVFFANYEVHTVSKDDGKGHVKAIGGNRLIWTQEQPYCSAKCRLEGMPERIPLDWSEYAKRM